MSQHSVGVSNRPPRLYVNASALLSRAMGRVAAALSAYAPTNGVDIAQHEEDADIVVLHVIGFPDTVAAIESIKARGKKYAMIQYCVRSTQKPSTIDWLPLWLDDACVAVWSYYDLPAMVEEDAAPAKVESLIGTYADTLRSRFYFAPMGVSPQFVKQAPSGRNRPYRLMTSGYVPESECIQESVDAVTALEARMFHLGPGFEFFGPNITQEEGVNDPFLVSLYNRSEYVAGLRRCEGFEMPALEGLLCGARPVCFDRPHYRHWFGSHAEYIPEGTPAEVTASLTEVLARPARPVTDEERSEVVAKFNWRTVIDGFYQVATPDARARVGERRLRLLWVGDAVIASGFAKSTHEVLNTLHQHYDVMVLGINYNGDPHPYPYPIMPALNHMTSGEMDQIGTFRIVEAVRKHNADIVVIQQDPWYFPGYLSKLREAEILVPVVGFVAVDAKNCKGHALNCLDHAIFWTEFGRDEAVRGGYTGTSSVVPLGVNLATFFPMPKPAARRLLELPVSLQSAFIVGNVNRNQPRKRLDLTVEYFCEWARRYRHDDAYLYLHVAPTGDIGWDVEQLMRYYGFGKRLILSQPDPGFGMTEEQLCATYNAFDVQVTTTAGEGWGLPTLEGMACGIPQLVPEWAALGEWTFDGAIKVPCTSTAAATNNLNTIGGVPDREVFVASLELLYTDRTWRGSCAERARDRASDPMFDWRNIGQAFLKVLKTETPRMMSRLVQQEAVTA